MLQTILDVDRVERAEEGHNVEDVAPHQAQLVDPCHGQLVVEQQNLPVGAVVEGQQVDEAGAGQDQQPDLAPDAAQQRDEEGADDQERAGRQVLSHLPPLFRSSPRPA